MVFCCLLIKWSSYVQYGTVVLSPLFNLFFNYLHVPLFYIILHYTTRVSIRVQVYGDGDGVDSKLIFDLLTRLLARLDACTACTAVDRLHLCTHECQWLIRTPGAVSSADALRMEI